MLLYGKEQVGENKQTYIDYYKKIKTIDKEKLLNKTFEDGSYGSKSYDYE